MLASTETSLSEPEREAVARFTDDVVAALGDDLVSVWLYGSRARGEERRPESDVDLIVITRSGVDARARVVDLATDAILEAGGLIHLSPHAWDTDWLQGRREIDSFFIQEVDRDKVVLFGRP